MPRRWFFFLVLATAGGLFLLADSGSGGSVLSGVGGLREELRDAQLLELPVAEGIRQADGGEFLFDFSLDDPLDMALLLSLAYADGGQGAPCPVTLFEDQVSRDTVILNSLGEEALRLPPEPGYDPLWAFYILYPLDGVMDPGAYDPSRVELIVETTGPAAHLFIRNSQHSLPGETPSYDEVLTPECGIAIMTLQEWRDNYCGYDENMTSKAYLVCTEPGAGSVKITFQTWADSAEAIDVTAEQQFTTPQIDVRLGGVDERKEEFPGACVEYVPDDIDGSLTWQGITSLVGVSITCSSPQPESSTVSVDAPAGCLFEKIGDQYFPANTTYPANQIGQKKFFLHGHITSGSLIDSKVTATLLNSSASDFANFTVVNVTHKNNSISERTLMVFDQNGVSADGFCLTPNPFPVEARWTVEGLPSEGTEIRWSSSTGQPEIGSGCAPILYVKYVLNLDNPEDNMPPDNSWFGKKGIAVSIGEKLVIKKPVTFCFSGNFESKMLNSDKVAAWYYYYIRAEAVSGLQDFKYVEVIDPSLPIGVTVTARWRPFYNDFQIARTAILSCKKTVIVNGKYATEDYDTYNFGGSGCHGVAKICGHEKWHKQLASEIRVEIHTLPYGGHYETSNDPDGDGLPDAREIEIESSPDRPDSFQFGPYSSGQDEEVFCRLKESEFHGVESLDWLIGGPQVSKIWRGMQ